MGGEACRSDMAVGGTVEEPEGAEAGGTKTENDLWRWASPWIAWIRGSAGAHSNRYGQISPGARMRMGWGGAVWSPARLHPLWPPSRGGNRS